MYERDYNIKWITQGIKFWSQEMQFLKNLKKKFKFATGAWDYIKRCHKIYIRVTLEAKLWENDKIQQEWCGI